jgi:hypothetical protein
LTPWLVGRAALSATLLASSASKAAGLGAFASTIRGLGVPRRWSRLSAVAIIGAEVALGVAGLTYVGPLALDRLLVVAFTSFLIVQIYGAMEYGGRECQCLGALVHTTFGPAGVLRSIGGVLVSGLVILWEPGSIAILAPAWTLGLLALSAAVTGATFVGARASAVFGASHG